MKKLLFISFLLFLLSCTDESESIQSQHLDYEGQTLRNDYLNDHGDLVIIDPVTPDSLLNPEKDEEVEAPDGGFGDANSEFVGNKKGESWDGGLNDVLYKESSQVSIKETGY